MRRDDSDPPRDAPGCAGSSSPFSCLRSSSSGAFPATPRTSGPGRSRPTCRRSSWAPATAPVRTSSRARLSHRAGTPSRSASSRPRSSPRSFSSSRCVHWDRFNHGDAPVLGRLRVLRLGDRLRGGAVRRRRSLAPKPAHRSEATGAGRADRLRGSPAGRPHGGRSAWRDRAGAPALAEPGSRSRAVGADAARPRGRSPGTSRRWRSAPCSSRARSAGARGGFSCRRSSSRRRSCSSGWRGRGAEIETGRVVRLDLPRRSRRDGPRDPRAVSADGELGRATTPAPAAGT